MEIFLAKHVLSVTVSHVLLVVRIFFLLFSAPVSHTNHVFFLRCVRVRRVFFFGMSCMRTSLHRVPPVEHGRLVCAKVLCVDWRIYLAMPPPSKRVHEAESSNSASAPKRSRGSAANWRRAGFEADPVMNSHSFTWQNASLKEPDEDNAQNP